MILDANAFFLAFIIGIVLLTIFPITFYLLGFKKKKRKWAKILFWISLIIFIVIPTIFILLRLR